MTTIILTIIGILLAAAAALMVIFYGGDAFNSGTIRAQANQVHNAGQNVVSAIQLFRSDTGRFPSSLNELRSPAVGGTLGPYLDEIPALPDGSVNPQITVGIAPDQPITPVGRTVATFSVEVSPALCAQLDRDLPGTGLLTGTTIAPSSSLADAIASLPQRGRKSGCIPIPSAENMTTGLFFIRAS